MGKILFVSVSKVKICKGICYLVSVFIVLRVDKVLGFDSVQAVSV